jgi:hypothetical protein
MDRRLRLHRRAAARRRAAKRRKPEDTVRTRGATLRTNADRGATRYLVCIGNPHNSIYAIHFNAKPAKGNLRRKDHKAAFMDLVLLRVLRVKNSGSVCNDGYGGSEFRPARFSHLTFRLHWLRAFVVKVRAMAKGSRMRKMK